MRSSLKLSALALALLVGAGGAQATALSALLNGGSITAGDKIFDQWSLIGYEAGDGRALNAGNIDITALNDGGLDPGPGLSFAVSGGEFDVIGDGIFNFVDLMFSFRVTAAAGFEIKDNSLNLTGGGLSWTKDNNEDLGFTIQEWVSSIGPVIDPATGGYIKTELSQLEGVSTSVTAASSQFAPSQSIWVTKDILVWSVDDTDTASLTGFTQRFSQQTVPEPATFGLVGMALLAAGFARRRAA
jgi:hypothetical protein